MKRFTPLLNFNADLSTLPSDFKGLTLAEITDEELQLYFRVSNRALTSTGYSCTQEKDNPRFYSLSALEQHDLIQSRFAFTSGQHFESHDQDVRDFALSIMLLEPSSFSSPVTFNSETPSIFSSFPFRGKHSGSFVLSDGNLARLRENLSHLHLISTEDRDLLRLVWENGMSPLSVLFLVTILERTLLKGESNQSEVSFKFRVFGAKLLSKHAALDEREVFDTLKRAYKIRSKVAHKYSQLEDITSLYPRLYDYVVTALFLDADKPELLKRENRDSLLMSQRPK